ncbi:MAG: hypothetical protein AAGH74_11565 [Pseudomonadota bacterium]
MSGAEQNALAIEAKLQRFKDGYLEGLIEARLAAAEFLPSELESLEMRHRRESKLIEKALTEAYDVLKRGLAVLAEHAPPETAAVLDKLQAAVARPLDPPPAADAPDPDALATAMPALIETCRALLDDKHLEDAKASASALCMLYPEVPHPYVLAGTAIWYVDGLEAALHHYNIVTQNFFEQPMVNYFAADVYLSAGDRDKCRALLQSGLELCDGAGPDAAAYKPEIEAFLAELAER